MMRMVLIMAFIFALGKVSAQSPLAAYIDQGLQSNLTLQQRNVSLEKAVSALKTAKSLYLPSVNFQGGYQTANGGRNIPLPIGDLLNPVYSTLNQLTQSNGFPSVENQTINFLPKNYYDAHIRTTLPLINTDIRHNVRIHEQQIRLNELDIDTYKRELVKAIKIGYYNYLSALRVVAIHRSAMGLAQEGKRTNERLVENGKGLPAYVLRSESEIAVAQAMLTESELEVRNAQLYFNSLLNRAEDAPIDTAFDHERALVEVLPTLQGGSTNTESREELQSLSTAIAIHETALKMERQGALPKLAAFLDLGSQSEGFHFNNQTRYYMAGVQMEFPLFNGFRTKHKVQQSKLDLLDARLRLQEAGQQFQLAGSVALHGLQSAWQNYQSAKRQLVAAKSYQRLITKGYQAGSNTYIETIDARNQYTTASLAVAINTYQVLSAAAAVEREQASFPLTL